MSRRMENRIMKLWVTGWDAPEIGRAVGRSEAYVADALGAVRARVSAKTAHSIRKLRTQNVRDRGQLRMQAVRVRERPPSAPALNFEVQAQVALRKRNEAIRGYLASGHDPAEIALSFGLSLSTIRAIKRAA